VHGATQQYPRLEAQLQATLNVIPAYTWYALPSGALTFVNGRTGDYLGLPKDHSASTQVQSGMPIFPCCIPMTAKSHAEYGQSVYKRAPLEKAVSESVTLKEVTEEVA
jgi:hypothetical protein